MDRYWLITSTFYGNWLPGDARGFVGRVRDLRAEDGDATSRVTHRQYGTEYDRDLTGLRRNAEERLRGPVIRLTADQAHVLMTQFAETCQFREWELVAASVMDNHIHAVIGVSGDPAPSTILQSLKSYGSRALNKRFGKPTSETWWTEGGSARILKKRISLPTAIRYVTRLQPDPLVVYPVCGGRQSPEEVHHRRESSSGD